MLATSPGGLTARLTAGRAERQMQAALRRPAACAMHLTGRQLPLHHARQPLRTTLRISSHGARRQPGRRAFRVCAGWGDPIDWTAAKVTSSRPAAEGVRSLSCRVLTRQSSKMQRLTVDTGSIAEGYKTPGQFVQVRVGDSKPGFFAIASPPDPNNQGVIELLVKAVPDTASELIAAAKEGDSVDVSPVMGKGFDMAKLSGAKTFSTVLLFATGSGIAPIKALIESDEFEVSSRQAVKLYYGTRSEALTPFRDEAAEWASSGVQLINVYSSEGKGYVQDVFAREAGGLDGASTAAVAIGQKQFFEQLTNLLLERGVNQEDILSNY